MKLTGPNLLNATFSEQEIKNVAEKIIQDIAPRLPKLNDSKYTTVLNEHQNYLSNPIAISKILQQLRTMPDSQTQTASLENIECLKKRIHVYYFFIHKIIRPRGIHTGIEMGGVLTKSASEDFEQRMVDDISKASLMIATLFETKTVPAELREVLFKMITSYKAVIDDALPNTPQIDENGVLANHMVYAVVLCSMQKHDEAWKIIEACNQKIHHLKNCSPTDKEKVEISLQSLIQHYQNTGGKLHARKENNNATNREYIDHLQKMGSLLGDAANGIIYNDKILEVFPELKEENKKDEMMLSSAQSKKTQLSQQEINLIAGTLFDELCPLLPNNVTYPQLVEKYNKYFSDPVNTRKILERLLILPGNSNQESSLENIEVLKNRIHTYYFIMFQIIRPRLKREKLIDIHGKFFDVITQDLNTITVMIACLFDDKKVPENYKNVLFKMIKNYKEVIDDLVDKVPSVEAYTLTIHMSYARVLCHMKMHAEAQQMIQSCFQKSQSFKDINGSEKMVLEKPLSSLMSLYKATSGNEVEKINQKFKTLSIQEENEATPEQRDQIFNKLKELLNDPLENYTLTSNLDDIFQSYKEAVTIVTPFSQNVLESLEEFALNFNPLLRSFIAAAVKLSNKKPPLHPFEKSLKNLENKICNKLPKGPIRYEDQYPAALFPLLKETCDLLLTIDKVQCTSKKQAKNILFAIPKIYTLWASYFDIKNPPKNYILIREKLTVLSQQSEKAIIEIQTPLAKEKNTEPTRKQLIQIAQKSAKKQKPIEHSENNARAKINREEDEKAHEEGLVKAFAAMKLAREEAAAKKSQWEASQALEKEQAKQYRKEKKEHKKIIFTDLKQNAQKETPDIQQVIEVKPEIDSIKKSKMEKIISRLQNVNINDPVTDAFPYHPCMPSVTLPKNVQKLMNLLEEAGYWVYGLGGCLRDFARGELPNDFDLVTNCPLDKLKALLIEKGYNYFNPITDLFVLNGLHVDLKHTTLDIKSYVEKFDYTINTLICNKEGKIYDILGKLKDFDKPYLKSLISSKELYEKNPVAILRGIRFHNTLKNLRDKHITLIQKYAHTVNTLPLPVYLRNMEALLLRKSAFVNFDFMLNKNILAYIVPGLTDDHIREYRAYWQWKMAQIDKAPTDYNRYHLFAILLLPLQGNLKAFFDTYQGDCSEVKALFENRVQTFSVGYREEYIAFEENRVKQLKNRTPFSVPQTNTNSTIDLRQQVLQSASYANTSLPGFTGFVAKHMFGGKEKSNSVKSEKKKKF